MVKQGARACCLITSAVFGYIGPYAKQSRMLERTVVLDSVQKRIGLFDQDWHQLSVLLLR